MRRDSGSFFPQGGKPRCLADPGILRNGPPVSYRQTKSRQAGQTACEPPRMRAVRIAGNLGELPLIAGELLDISGVT